MSLCKDCYTLEKFAKDIGIGTYVVCDGSHVVAVTKESNDVEGNWFDSYNSKSIVPIFYLEKVEDGENVSE